MVDDKLQINPALASLVSGTCPWVLRLPEYLGMLITIVLNMYLC